MLLPVIYAWRRDWIDVRWRIDREVFAAVCRYGIPLSLTVALAVVIGSSDRFLIAAMRGDDAAGLYSVGFDFTTQTLTLLMMVISLAVFPIAVRAYEEHGREAAQDQMRHNASLLMAVGIPSVVGLSLLAPNIAHCFLGKSFRVAASGIIPLIALGSFLAGMKAYHFDAAFQFVHRTIHQVWIVLVAALVNLGLNFWAIPRFGINGAAGVSVFAYIVSIVLTIWIGRRHFVLPFPSGAMFRVLLASGAMAIVIWPLREYRGALAMAAQMAVAVPVYGAILLSVDFLGIRQMLSRRLQSRRALARITTQDD
jgi:O-antigen/teichoic acid export membrane protein